MAQRAHVPKFGDGGSEEPERKGGGGGKTINPNDPQENPDVFPNIASAAQDPPPKTRAESVEPWQAAYAPLPMECMYGALNENMKWRVGDESPCHASAVNNFYPNFEAVPVERRSVAENPGGIGNVPANSNVRNQAARDNDRASCCSCFTWGGK